MVNGLPDSTRVVFDDERAVANALVGQYGPECDCARSLWNGRVAAMGTLPVRC